MIATMLRSTVEGTGIPRVRNKPRYHAAIRVTEDTEIIDTNHAVLENVYPFAHPATKDSEIQSAINVRRIWSPSLTQTMPRLNIVVEKMILSLSYHPR